MKCDRCKSETTLPTCPHCEQDFEEMGIPSEEPRSASPIIAAIVLTLLVAAGAPALIWIVRRLALLFR